MRLTGKRIAFLLAEGVEELEFYVPAGGTWVDAPALREGHLVWGRVVADIPAFCRELVAALIEAAASAPPQQTNRLTV
jgi:putative intracellular protease/amidase